jgi:hypothetical protein
LIGSSSRGNQKRSLSIPYNDVEPAGLDSWALFFLVQALDIHSTNKAIKYDCLKEANPLLPAVPEVWEMLLLKAIILIPTYKTIQQEQGYITADDLLINTSITSLAVYNNYDLFAYARSNCNIR